MEIKAKVKSIFLLHIMLFFYSLGGVCSKLAAKQEFMSVKFILYYMAVLGILFLYAVLWQQILKRLPLVTAYSNKAVTVIWGILWGQLFFQEAINTKKIVGAVIIILGVILVVTDVEKS